MSYYRPYRRLLIADMVCAFMVAAVTLILPLLVRYITKNILEEGVSNALGQIYIIGAIMLALVAMHTVCNYFCLLYTSDAADE